MNQQPLIYRLINKGRAIQQEGASSGSEDSNVSQQTVLYSQQTLNDMYQWRHHGAAEPDREEAQPGDESAQEDTRHPAAIQDEQQQCTLCQELRYIEVHNIRYRWGDRLCARCAVLSRLVQLTSELPPAMETSLLMSLEGFIQMWTVMLAQWRRFVYDYWMMANEVDTGDH